MRELTAYDLDKMIAEGTVMDQHPIIQQLAAHRPSWNGYGYEQWRRDLEFAHGAVGLRFQMMIQSGKVIGAEAWRGSDMISKWTSESC